MQICPKCHHKQTEQDKALSPHECPQCGCFYNARDYINAEKRRQNLELKPWRITRWRPQYKTGLIFGVPVVMVVAYVVYQFGLFVIANSRPISNELYQLTKSESELPAAPSAAEAPTRSQAPSIETDVLTVTARKTVTVWFIDPTTNKKNGPFLVTRNKPEKIHLERGIYTAKIINDGKLTLVTVNFLETEKLDL